jgi:large conductance mechanosensitive channel
MIKEFRDFIMRGNVVELAVGIIIGAAFNNIVTALIHDVITPLLLKPALDAAKLSNLEDLTFFGTVHYGVFLSATLNFIIVAFILFLIVKGTNSALRKNKESKAVEITKEEQILSEIRDILRNQNSNKS